MSFNEAKYRAALAGAGLPPEQINEACASERREHECMDARVCPGCGAPLTVTLDARQAGLNGGAGAWYNYRCTARCGFFCDRAEGAN